MTFDKPTRPAPPMPAIKQPAIDYRALLVRYMASIIEAEGISFVGHAYEVEFSTAEIEALRQIQVEASALLDVEVEEFAPVIIAPRRRVFLHGVERLGVLAFGEDDGLKWVDVQDDEAIVSQPEIPTVRVYNQNFEFKEV